MQPLQGIQNTLCRIVTRTHRFSSVTSPLISLHWLPVKSRVQFKVCLITYKVYKFYMLNILHGFCRLD